MDRDGRVVRGEARSSRRASLTQRLAWLTIAVTGAALLAACAAFILYDQITYRRLMVRQLAVEAQVIAANSVSALIFGDPRSAAKTLSTLSASPDLLAAGIYDHRGRLFAFYRRGGAPLLPPSAPPMPPFGQRSWYADGDVILARRITLAGAVAGTVYLRNDMKQLTTRNRHYTEIAFIVWAASLTAAWIFSTAYRRGIAQPIVDLAHTAVFIAHDQDYGLRAQATGRGDEIDSLVEAFNAMLAAIGTRDADLAQARQTLEARVAQRTAELTAANRELEAFSYSVSHDLRAPLRGIDGFGQALLEDYGAQMDPTARSYLDRIRAATQRMGVLIDNLLQLARVTRAEMRRENCDLSAMAAAVVEDLRRQDPGRQSEVEIEPGMHAWGDAGLLRIVLENFLGNAWKFTAKREWTWIAFYRANHRNPSEDVFAIRDNGAGFDPAHAGQLFAAFQRLHAATEFPGTGIGLATAQRILHRHGGRAWAEAQLGAGATFYFALPRYTPPLAASS